MIQASTPRSADSGVILTNELTWSQSCWGQVFEFQTNGQAVATLQRPSFWSSSYLGTSNHGRWWFRRAGFSGTRAEILDADTERPVAQFEKEWGGPGVLMLNDGQRFCLRSSGWWRPVWSLMTGSGEWVLDLRPRDRTVQLTSSSAMTDSLLWLMIMFVMYRVQQVEEETSAS